jgi:acid phosphatase type 7
MVECVVPLAYVTRRTFFKTSAAALTLSSSVRAANGFSRQPYLQRVLRDRASILWTAFQPAAAAVAVIAPDGSYTSFAATATPFTPDVTALPATYHQFKADITGLQPGTVYQYKITMGGASMASDPYLNSFQTPKPGNFSFLVLGDSGMDTPEQVSLIGQMLTEPGITKVIHVGDIAYESGTFAQFEQNFFALYAPMLSRVPFFTTPGNHEYLTNSAAPYLSVYSTPDSSVPAQDAGRYYSFDWGDAHFVSLDSNLLPLDAGPRMLAWLDADLAATGKYWKVVFLHHPPYPTGNHLGDPICELVQQSVNPIVERHGVQLVLAGHEHGYERSFPLLSGQKANPSGPSTTYLISGGGGATLTSVGALPQCALSLSTHNYLRVDVTGSMLTFAAKAPDGSVIDRITLAPPPLLNASGIVNAGDFSPIIAAGSLVSIFGQNLATRTGSSQGLPLSTQINGVSVTANGVVAPLVFASPTQLNLQMPWGVSDSVTLRISTANGSVAETVNVAPTAPSILSVVSGTGFVSASNPAIPGGYLTIYATGFGAPQGDCPTGQAPAGPMAMSAPVLVRLGNSILQPAYAGLAPELAGLNQVNVQLPASLAAGVYALSVVVGGAVSSAASVHVAAR